MGSGRIKILKVLFGRGIRLGTRLTGLSEQFILFLAMGGINTLFYYSLYSLLIYIGLFYAAAVVIATVCGVLFNFQTFGRVVFKDFQMRLLGRFVCVYAVVCAANIAGLRLLEYVGLVNKYIAGAVLVLPVALLGYVLNKTFVFNRKASERKNPPLPKGNSD